MYWISEDKQGFLLRYKSTYLKNEMKLLVSEVQPGIEAISQERAQNIANTTSSESFSCEEMVDGKIVGDRVEKWLTVHELLIVDDSQVLRKLEFQKVENNDLLKKTVIIY